MTTPSIASWATSALLLAMLMGAGDAMACAVCGAATTPEQKEALLSGTIGLTVLPLTMLAVVATGLYLQRRGTQKKTGTPKRVPKSG